MSTATRGLSIADVESIRDTLAAGRRPRVLFTEAAGQIAGQVGQVVKLTDPDASDDFLVVRFGRDELPFSPADLTIPPRGSGAAKAARSAAASKDTAVKKPSAADVEPAEDDPADTARGSATSDPMPAGPPLLPSPREEQKPMPTSKAAPTTPDVDEEPDAAPAAPAPRKAAKQARAKAPAGLTVTLAYTDGEWTVAAQQGSKALAKPYVIKPTEALKMVAMLDVAGVQEAVEAIVASERADAQQHAERLRAQLAEIEAKLAELGLPS
jgi:hypothetical protein